MSIRNSTDHHTAGLTLIELVVVMAIFALVAVMGVQSLTGTLRISDRLRGIDSATSETGTAIALLRNDLTSIVPMFFYQPGDAPRAAVWQSDDERVFGFSLAGQPTLGEVVTDRHYAEWRFDGDSGQLLRRHWPSLLPAQPSQVGQEALVLGGVNGVRLRTWWDGIGWVQGVTPPLDRITLQTKIAVDEDVASAPAAAYYSNLPKAIEITLIMQQSGDIRILQTLR